ATSSLKAPILLFSLVWSSLCWEKGNALGKPLTHRGWAPLLGGSGAPRLTVRALASPALTSDRVRMRTGGFYDMKIASGHLCDYRPRSRRQLSRSRERIAQGRVSQGRVSCLFRHNFNRWHCRRGTW